MTVKRVHTCRGKRRYRDRQQATTVLHNPKNESTRERVPVRAYDCPRCGGWHLAGPGARW